jgi:hypothetical protein
MSYRAEEIFTARFIDEGSNVHLELTNECDQPLNSIEVLTIFLKDEETPGGGPSQAHIRFEPIKSIQPKEKTVLSHKTWINGKPAAPAQDQLKRLKANLTCSTFRGRTLKGKHAFNGYRSDTDYRTGYDLKSEIRIRNPSRQGLF